MRRSLGNAMAAWSVAVLTVFDRDEVVGPARGLRWDQVLAPGTADGSAVSREAT